MSGVGRLGTGGWRTDLAGGLCGQDWAGEASKRLGQANEAS